MTGRFLVGLVAFADCFDVCPAPLACMDDRVVGGRPRLDVQIAAVQSR
jgi:hypothetical protein